MIRIGTLIDVEASVADAVAQAAAIKDAGYDSAWANQIFGQDALTLLAVVGASVPDIELGTAVVPVYPRHPQMLAQQALTVQSASGDRLCLGIGLSHQMVVEGLWGYSYDRPGRYMAEYLSALMPMLRGEVAMLDGEVLKSITVGPLDIPATKPPSVVVAALAPYMLKLAGTLTDGTITWMTGIGTIGSHIAPLLGEAAEAAGKPAPRVVVSLPVCLTDDAGRAKDRIDEAFSIYPNLPWHRPARGCGWHRARCRHLGRFRGAGGDLRVPGFPRWLSGARDLAAQAGVLELIDFLVGDDEVEEPGDDLFGGRRIVGIGAVHQPDERRISVVDHEGGDAEDVQIVVVVGPVGGDDLAWSAGGQLGIDDVEIDAMGDEDRIDLRSRGERDPLDVASVEERAMDRSEMLRRHVAHRNRDFKGQERRIVCRVVPDRWCTWLEMPLRERPRLEGHIEVETSIERAEHVLVHVSGEGAPVVIEKGEGNERHAISNPRQPDFIPARQHRGPDGAPSRGVHR